MISTNMTPYEKFDEIMIERDVEKQVEMIDDLSEQDAKDILKGYVRFIRRNDTPNISK